MKILWFTNIPLAAMARKLGPLRIGSGSWMDALLGGLVTAQPVQVTVVSTGPCREEIDFEESGVRYRLVPEGALLRRRSEADLLGHFARIIESCAPDVLHVHGTERLFGLLTARRLVQVPAVISLQGLLGPYAQWRNCFGTYSVADVLRMHRLPELVLHRGSFAAYMAMRRAARREMEIILGNTIFLGRTDWDRAYVRSVNAAARYFHVGEVLRREFWARAWQLDACDRHSIIFTNAGHPRKGAETLVRAAAILGREYPDVRLRLAGNISQHSGYGRYLRRLIQRSNARVEYLGPLTAAQMSDSLCKAHVFASPSLIDNSPNSVCEAMLVGMPCVCSYTGGTPSLLADGQTGLFFPVEDAPVLAERIRAVFEDDALAVRLGHQAREVAQGRHAPAVVVAQLMRAYEYACDTGRAAQAVS